MDIVTDNWIRRCIGVALIVCSLAVLVLAAAPLVYAVRWW